MSAAGTEPKMIDRMRTFTILSDSDAERMQAALLARGDNVARCVGCGCTDLCACNVIGGCWWLDVDYDDGTGVCSECPDHLEAWQRDHSIIGDCE